MGLFDFFKKANDDHIQNTTTIRYATDAQPANNTAAAAEQMQPAGPVAGTFRITVQDVFNITGRGTVITGCVELGQVSVGDVVQLRRVDGTCKSVTIGGIEVFRKMLDTATVGMNVGILIRDIEKSEIGRGDVLER